MALFFTFYMCRIYLFILTLYKQKYFIFNILVTTFDLQNTLTNFHTTAYLLISYWPVNYGYTISMLLLFIERKMDLVFKHFSYITFLHIGVEKVVCSDKMNVNVFCRICRFQVR